MNTYEIVFQVTVSGLGTRTVTITVQADSLEAALVLAKTQLIVSVPQSIRKV